MANECVNDDFAFNIMPEEDGIEILVNCTVKIENDHSDNDDRETRMGGKNFPVLSSEVSNLQKGPDKDLYTVNTVAGKKRYQCNVCNNECPDKTAITRHIRTHTRDKPYKCMTCLKSFQQKFSLSAHMLYTHKSCYFIDRVTQKYW